MYMESGLSTLVIDYQEKKKRESSEQPALGHMNKHGGGQTSVGTKRPNGQEVMGVKADTNRPTELARPGTASSVLGR